LKKEDFVSFKMSETGSSSSSVPPTIWKKYVCDIKTSVFKVADEDCARCQLMREIMKAASPMYKHFGDWWGIHDLASYMHALDYNKEFQKECIRNVVKVVIENCREAQSEAPPPPPMPPRPVKKSQSQAPPSVPPRPVRKSTSPSPEEVDANKYYCTKPWNKKTGKGKDECCKKGGPGVKPHKRWSDRAWQNKEECIAECSTDEEEEEEEEEVSSSQSLSPSPSPVSLGH
jgi:hypothetical protein